MKDCTLGSQPLRQVMHRCVWSCWTAMQMRLGLTWAVHHCSHGHRSYPLTLSRVSTVHDAMQFMIRYAGAQRRMLSTVFSRVFVCAVLPESFHLIFTQFQCSSILSRYSWSSNISVASINIITIFGVVHAERARFLIQSVQVNHCFICVYEIAILLDFIVEHPLKHKFSVRHHQSCSIPQPWARCIGNIMMEPAPYMSLGCQESGTEMEQSGNKFAGSIHVWYGGFLKWWYPQNTPKWSFFSRKTNGCWVPPF